MRLANPNFRALLAFLHDIAAVAVAWLVAFAFRFNLEMPDPFVQNMLQTALLVVPIYAVIFLRLGLYRGMWRYASLPDFERIIMAVGLAAVLTPAALLLLRLALYLPRSVLVLHPILVILFMGGSRLAYRAWKEHWLYGKARRLGEPVLVLGAGQAAVHLVKELSRGHEWRVVGLLDDDSAKHRRLVQDVRVLGPLDDLRHWAGRLTIKYAIVAMPSASRAVLRHAVDLCTAAGIKVLTVPSFGDLVSGRVTVSQIRRVELDDLLGRDPVTLDNAGLHEWLDERVIMISGAGGSIGAELCRQIARYRPRLLVLFEHNEFALYRIEQEFSEAFPDTPIACAIGDVKNLARVEQVMRRYAPSVVFHAAAYKHVPLMEYGNSWEALQNNVIGTYTLARAALENAVDEFVLISTDKAVNPTNVMGASKRLAEMVCQALQQSSGTRFVMVRFGNVLGSAGSVIPRFRQQIAKGGPITVTHPEVMRYFMSIPEASQLVLQAGLMGKGGEIFVLEMGEPVKIVDLANTLIRLSGFNDGEIDIVYTGLRPGEKLFEELLADDENTMPTPHPKLRIARARAVEMRWLSGLLAWLSDPKLYGDKQVKSDLAAWLPEYRDAPNINDNYSERRAIVRDVEHERRR